jgi:co-chaperonin GroES (HSP10)|tara:strand:- start:1051 stop:1308 length:258 start_codon:yes stop_codon:yes gene_type:complete
MKAINYYIVIEKIKEAPKKVGGLELTEKQDSDIRYLKGTVISVGDKIEGIKEKDIVRYDKHAGHGIEWKDNFYYVITIKDVVIVE